MESFPPYKEIDHPAMPKSHINGLLIILMVTLFASGGALILLKQIDAYHRQQLYIAEQAALPVHKTGKLESQKVENQKEIQFQVSTSTPVSIEDWKTYENKEYGFSFEYPVNGKIVAVKRGAKLELEQGNIFIEEVSDALPSCYKADMPKDLKIMNGYEWHSCESGWTINYHQSIYSFYPESPEMLSGNKDLIEKILSTFKFTK